MISDFCCCGFGKKEEPENVINEEIIPSARTPVASPRSEDEISIDEIILVESDENDKTEEQVDLPKSKAIVEHVTRGLSKFLFLKTLDKRFSCRPDRPRQNPAEFVLLREQNNEPARQFDDCYFTTELTP